MSSFSCFIENKGVIWLIYGHEEKCVHDVVDGLNSNLELESV